MALFQVTETFAVCFRTLSHHFWSTLCTLELEMEIRALSVSFQDLFFLRCWVLYP